MYDDDCDRTLVVDEILKQAKWAVDNGERLTSAQQTILSEYVMQMRARLKILDTLGVRGRQVQKLERKRILKELDKYGPHV